MLVVGGGIGASARELVKHPMVEEIHLCEIDKVRYNGGMVLILVQKPTWVRESYDNSNLSRPCVDFQCWLHVFWRG